MIYKLSVSSNIVMNTSYDILLSYLIIISVKNEFKSGIGSMVPLPLCGTPCNPYFVTLKLLIIPVFHWTRILIFLKSGSGFTDLLLKCDSPCKSYSITVMLVQIPVFHWIRMLKFESPDLNSASLLWLPM